MVGSATAANKDGGDSPHEAPARKARPQRPRELQDPLNYYLYHPLAWQLARLLAKTPITPNMVSVIGGLFVVAAAFVYAQPWWPYSALLGMALHMTWHVVDGADGDLARLTGRASPIGEMVDGICDYASHIVLYFVLAVLLARQIDPAIAWSLMVAAGLSHIVQSNHVEVQRRSYQWWVYGVPWLSNTRRSKDPAALRGGLAGLADLYLRLANKLTPHAHRIDAAVEAAGSPAQLENIHAVVRAEAPPLLRILKILGPNPRAIVLGIAMLVGSPMWYFLYQSVVLNLVLVWSVIAHNAAANRIAQKLAV
jgi:phosphatidylglycerophosphate synthase